MRHIIHTLFLSATLALCANLAHADDHGDVSKLIRAGMNGDAITKADAYLAGKPKDPQMRFLKGVAQNAMGKTEEAVGTFNKLIEDYPELPEPYNNLGVIYAGKNQYDKARAAFEMAVRNNPGYAVAHENLGDVHVRLANQAYIKALQIDPSNPSVVPKLKLTQDMFAPKVSAKAKK
jgi:Flp pilus assembly protein TadD